MSISDRKALQTRCKELGLPRCNEKSELLRQRIAEREAELLQQTGLLDLPIELLMDEILPSVTIRDLLNICGTNRSLSRLCHDGDFLSRLLRSYDYRQLQEAILYWGWTGRMVDRLMAMVDELKEKIEFATIHRLYLYLMERNDPELTKYALILKERTIKPKDIWDGNMFPSYDQLWKPLEEFVASLRGGASYKDSAIILFKINISGFSSPYLADLIIKTLREDEIRTILSDEYYDEAIPIDRFSSWFFKALYDALVRSKRIDVLDPLFLRRWRDEYSATYDINVDRLYWSLDSDQAARIVQYHQTHHISLYSFSHRSIHNRTLLLGLQYKGYWEPLRVMVDEAYRFVTPDELYTILVRTTRNDSVAITIITRNIVHYAKMYGFALWVKRMGELLPESVR